MIYGSGMMLSDLSKALKRHPEYFQIRGGIVTFRSVLYERQTAKYTLPIKLDALYDDLIAHNFPHEGILKLFDKWVLDKRFPINSDKRQRH